MGIQGKVEFAFPMTYDFSHPLDLGGTPPNPQALNCLSGSASATMTVGIHLWNINGPLTIFNVPLLSVNDTNSPCPFSVAGTSG